MIPKVIHLCWLSGDEFPLPIAHCIDSWKKILPDYEICLWDTKRFDINSTIWTEQAFSSRKYAFAADYIRLYALYNFGGIYLDSDVLVYKSFDELLHLPYFIGQEYTGSFEPAVIGAERGCPFIGKVLERYRNRPFIKEDGSYDILPLPAVFFNTLIKSYNFRQLNSLTDYQWDGKTIFVFDKDFFHSRDSMSVTRTPKSYCSHCYAGSWLPKQKGLKYYLLQTLPKWLIKFYYSVSHRTFRFKKIHQTDPIYYNKRK